MSKYCVIDLETNGGITHKRLCNQFDAKHSIQCISYSIQGSGSGAIYNETWEPLTTIPTSLFTHSILVGQNFKFDMLWLCRSEEFREWLSTPTNKVWDTQTVQYLLDGQDNSPRNLDALVNRYGGTLKDDRVKAMYESGLQSKDIPQEILIPYAIEDVKNTELVFRQQYKIASGERNLLPLIRVYMRHYLALTDIEYNGMFVSVDILREKEQELIKDINNLEGQLKEKYGMDEPGSPMQVAQFLFGTKYDSDKKRISTDEAALLRYQEICTDEKTSEMIDLILELRNKNKMLSTYVNKVEMYKAKKRLGEVKSHTGLIPLVHKDGCLHSEYQAAYTRTGRLSSRNPNLQNLPKELLNAFTSRNKQGMIVEIDFSQLEVCVAAQISEDAILREEIKNKIDFHRRNAAFLYNVKENKVTPDQRKMAKALTFALFYGAREERMAADKGISVDLAKRFIDGFYDKYLDFKEWHSSLEKQVVLNSRLTGNFLVLKDGTTSNELQQVSYLEMPWGKRYTFYDKGVRTRRGDIFRYWPTTDIKNLPVQGTASDLVNMMVGRLWRKLVPLRSKVLMVNEIHDSIILDVLNEQDVTEVVELAKYELTNVATAFAQEFDYNWVVPISVEAKAGKDWLLCKKSEAI